MFASWRRVDCASNSTEEVPGPGHRLHPPQCATLESRGEGAAEEVNMRNRLPKGILGMAAIAARVICQAHTNVYSTNIPSFAERNGLTNSRFVQREVHVPHQADEVSLSSYTSYDGSNSWGAAWFVTTNTLAKQPRWDGISSEAPLSSHKACALAVRHVRDQFPEIKSWSVESIELRHPYLDQIHPSPDVWIYAITFKPRAPAVLIESSTNCCLSQFVLLDGTVVPPRFTKQE